jgi:actin-like ATPase involved in cell morphogenesis
MSQQKHESGDGRDSADGRRHRRYPVRWAVEIEVGDWHDALTLTTDNISRGGLFVRSAERTIEPGAPMRVTLLLPDQTRFTVDAEVVHVIHPPQQQGGPRLASGFGVRFDDKHTTDLLLLEAMAASHAAGANRYELEPFISLEAVLKGLEDGFTTRTSAHQLLPHGGVPAEPEDSAASREVYAMMDLPREAKSAAPTEASAGAQLRATDETVDGLEIVGRDLDEPPPIPDREDLDETSIVSETTDGVIGGDTEMDHSPEVGGFSMAPTSEGLPKTSAPRLGTGDMPVLPDDADDISIDVDLDERADSEALKIDPGQAIFGIDFGTSYSSIALVVDDQLLVLHDAEGQTLVPSAVCYPEQGAPLVGWKAREKQLTHPTTTFLSPKRLIGRDYDDPAVAALVGQSPVRFAKGPNGQTIADVYGDPISLPQVAAEIMRGLVDLAEEATSLRPQRVVLSAPVAYGAEREAIRVAAKLAGLEVVGLLVEPYAAALSYGLGREDQTVCVFDFGGGTLDITLLAIEDGQFRVLAESGDPWLGGDDFDLVVAGWAADMFHRERKVELRDRAVEWQRLLFLCERAKRRLSFEQSTTIEAKGIVLSIKGPVDLRVELAREQLELLSRPLVERAIQTLRDCFQQAGIGRDAVDRVVMTGGVSRMPLVRKLVGEYFGRPIELSVDPEQAIVVGNALFGRFKAMAEQREAGR